MSGNQIQRIFLDVSHTFRSGENTGIQRVVRKLGEFLPTLARNGDLVCQPVIFDRGRFWTTADGHESIPFCSREKSLERFSKAAPNFLVPASPPTGQSTACKATIGKRANTANRLLQRPFDVYWKWHRFCSKLQFSEAVDFGTSDILVMPDGYWSLNEIWPAVGKAKQAGAWVACLVYDIICLTHPEFFPEKPVSAFRRYLKNVHEHADCILTISNAVRRQLERHRQVVAGYSNHPDIRVFRLGADRHDGPGAIRQQLQRTFHSDQKPFVLVATLEPRKNHHFVLDAFDELWSRGGEQKLVLAGKVGWSCTSLLERIRKHPELGHKLFVFHDLSDREIGYCYEHSRGVIAASLTEGFGLPIIEGMRYGKPVFASDIEVHREAGSNGCRYFSLGSPTALVEALTEFEKSQHNQVPSLGRSSIPSWEASTTEFLRVVLEQWAEDRAKSREPTRLQDRHEFARDQQLMAVKSNAPDAHRMTAKPSLRG